MQKPGPENDDLNKALKLWEITGAPAPRFEDRVWQRISVREEMTQPKSYFLFISWLGRKLGSPMFVTSSAAVIVVIGLFAGYWTGKTNSQSSETLGNRYVQLMDPYQTRTH